MQLSEFELAVRRLYQEPDGKFVIDKLKDIYLNKRHMPGNILDGGGVGCLLSYHEGQKDVVLMLHDTINKETGELK